MRTLSFSIQPVEVGQFVQSWAVAVHAASAQRTRTLPVIVMVVDSDMKSMTAHQKREPQQQMQRQQPNFGNID